MGIPVMGKNIFPSNIQGLPTKFSIRVSEKGHLSRDLNTHIQVAMNRDTLVKDHNSLKPGNVFLYNSDFKLTSFEKIYPIWDNKMVGGWIG